MNATISWMNPRDTWGNRTMINGSSMRASEQRSPTTVGEAALEHMIDEHQERFGAGPPVSVPARTDLKPEDASSDFQFAGWDPSPLGGELVASPIAFANLEFPVDGEPCPDPAFSPWWDSVVPQHPTSAAICAADGSALYSGRRSPRRWELNIDRNREAGAMEVHENFLLLKNRYRFDFERLSESGLGLTLISPTLADVKDFLSETTAKRNYLAVGCQVPLSAIVAVGYRLGYSMIRPLFGKAKRQFEAAGHGSLKFAEAFVEVNDGWGPLHATLSWHFLAATADVDLALLDLVATLRMKTAAQRLASAQLDDAAAKQTEVFAAPMPKVSSATQEKDAFDKVAVKTEVWRIPGATVFGGAPMSTVEPLLSHSE